MKRQNNQNGFVAIILAMIIMIFASLVALGFAFLARQNQAQNQNRVLSTQAFYAAESGVNDAIQFLKTNPTASNLTDCSKQLPPKTGDIGSTNTDIKYTCVLYNTAPTSLQYPGLSTNDSRVIKVQAKDGQLGSITISWRASNGSTAFASNNQHWLPQDSVITYDSAHGVTDGNDLAQSTGMIQTTLIPVYGTISRNDLQTKAQTLFLYPKQAGNSGTPTQPTSQPFLTSASYSDTNQGKFVDGACNAANSDGYCHVTITNLDRLGGTSTFYLRLKAIYQLADVTITAKTTDGNTAQLVGEQATIDATGKADDVLRRIQVRVPLLAGSLRPEFAADSLDGVCKRLQVWPNGYNISWNSIPDPNSPTGKVGSQPSACSVN